MTSDNTTTTTSDTTTPGSAGAQDAATSAGADAVDSAPAEGAAADAAAKGDEILRDNIRLRDLYARAIADFDNYRRRVVREKEELRKLAAQELIEDLIPVLDNLGIGLATAEKHPEAGPVADGFKMIAGQIKATLESHGLREISPLGEPFDPNVHESVSETPHETIPEHNVAVVLRTGYRLHDRLVRPASVVLSTGKN
ncbi:MAG: nucleotide exchange factor GrpE [Puniceicoccales bacterium]|nr:nucleotide exchange factor GrpE [Puniceicoccales bacterium]